VVDGTAVWVGGRVIISVVTLVWPAVIKVRVSVVNERDSEAVEDVEE
jgi:hypothetical protein